MQSRLKEMQSYTYAVTCPTKNKALLVLVMFAPAMEQYEGQHDCNPSFAGFCLNNPVNHHRLMEQTHHLKPSPTTPPTNYKCRTNIIHK